MHLKNKQKRHRNKPDDRTQNKSLNNLFAPSVEE